LESEENIDPGDQTIPMDPVAAPRLRVLPAAVVFGVYFAVQIVVGLAAGIIAVVAVFSSGLDIKDPQVLTRAARSAMAPATVLGLALSGAMAITLSILWFKNEVKDRSKTGGAWVAGKPTAIFAGLGIGAFVAMGYVIIVALIHKGSDAANMGPLARMAIQPGMGQMAWILTALLLAPPIEELLFRGVLFGGICRSWGAPWAAIVTTGVFILLHVNEMIHFWPAFIFVASMAAAALWLRLRTKAIAPSIAVHFGYNLVLVVIVLLATHHS
jgi:membrane protease YdiL (CAAX protease family)